MAEYIHVIASTNQPIYRASQTTVFENLQPAAADNYNATTGVAGDRAFLPVVREADPVVPDPILEKLVQPTTLGYASEFSDTSQPPTVEYIGKFDNGNWLIQKELAPTTLEEAKARGQFERQDKYSAFIERPDGVTEGWPYPLPNGSTTVRIPFSYEFAETLRASVTRADFVAAQGIPVGNQIPIRTEIGNYTRPLAEVKKNVAAMIRDFGAGELVDINGEQSIRTATTPAQVRARVDAIVYPLI